MSPLLKQISLAALPILLAATGCANRGNPRPPSLHLPEPAANLKAERVANRVLLSWTTTDKTSDGLILHAPITAVLCRDTATRLQGRPTAPCTPILRLPITPGDSHAADTLPPALLADPPHLLAYRVELLNPKNRSAGPSAPAFAPSGAAPPDTGTIRISATRPGAVIEWTTAISTSVSTMELTRTLIAHAQGPVTPSTPSPKKSSPAALPTSSPKNPATPILLRAAPSIQPDPGGLLDPAVLPHDTYTYTAQRVRTVQLDGRPYDLRSAPSPTATFSYRDIFPPRPPSGLESIASAPLTGQPSIDLSWDASPEPDLLGYNIYRTEAKTGSSAPFTRLNPTPVPSPAFRDLTAQPGHPYRYRVTAVDRSGNESPPSPEIRDSLPAPQP